MAQGDVFRLTRIVIVDGAQCVNVLHFLDTNGSSPTPEQDILDLWNDPTTAVFTTEDRYAALQDGFTSYTQVSLSCQQIFPVEGDIFTEGMKTNKGAAVDSGLPTFNQVKFRIYTDRQDRSGRGGFYMPAIAESATSGNVVTAAFTVELEAFLTGFADVWTAGGSEFAGYAVGVFSRLLLEFNAATSFEAASTLGSMVSRKIGHGA